MIVSLEKKADLLLLQNGFDLKGKKVKRKNKFILTKRQIKDHKLPAKVIKDNRDLIQLRKESELSEPELVISEFLSTECIPFEREYYMKGLFNPTTNKPLFFDFYIPKYNLVIEYDGVSHYKNEKDPNKLIEQKKRDKIKNIFCRKRKIFILRIPYWKQSRIVKVILEFIDKIESGVVSFNNNNYDRTTIHRPKPDAVGKI